MHLAHAIVLPCLVLGLASVHAQSSARALDLRVTEILTKTGLQFEVSPDGHFQIALPLPNGRSQQVLLHSKTRRIHGTETREVWSVGHATRAPLPAHVMRRLLHSNHAEPMGAWKMLQLDAHEVVIFHAHVAADANATLLLATLRQVAQAADLLEKDLTGQDKL